MIDLNEQSFSLTYLERINIENKKEGLSEPSGLALSHNRNALWIISDDTKRIFKLSLNGDLKKDDCFDIPDRGLEGITLDPTGTYIFTVKEESNEIIKIQIDTQEVFERQPLSNMVNYNAVAQYFRGGGSNKGLEGITWNRESGTIFVMKEGRPGLLIEVSSDLSSIRNYHVLNEESGFLAPEMDAIELDFSDLCYDPYREHFWIVSDKAKRLFLYSWKANKVIQSSRLSYGKDGQFREIAKAEGVAIDPSTNRLYIVSDEEVRLYVFDIRE